MIGARIKARRSELGLTLLQVAELAGVKEATVQRWESGKIKSVTYENVISLSEALHCTPSYLMGWEQDTTMAEQPTTQLDDELPSLIASASDEDIAILRLLSGLAPERKSQAMSYLRYLAAEQDSLS